MGEIRSATILPDSGELLLVIDVLGRDIQSMVSHGEATRACAVHRGDQAISLAVFLRVAEPSVASETHGMELEEEVTYLQEAPGAEARRVLPSAQWAEAHDLMQP